MQFYEVVAAFRIWAPLDGRWSPWAKPVAFDCKRTPAVVAILPAPDWIADLPYSDPASAFIIELSAADTVEAALALAAHGIRPVPLYNATTGVGRNVFPAPALTDVLYSATPFLEKCEIRPDARPAFMIDINRYRGDPTPDDYDNRWIVFPQDFPSARVLRDSGIARLVVIRPRTSMTHDLRAVLRTWKRAGIQVQYFDPQTRQLVDSALDLSLIATFVDHLRLVFNGLKSNNAGGFGGAVASDRGGG